MADARVAQRARSLGIDRVPAVLVDGKLAACCTGARITEDALRAEGVGQPIA
jgi:glutaredoxin 3